MENLAPALSRSTYKRYFGANSDAHGEATQSSSGTAVKGLHPISTNAFDVSLNPRCSGTWIAGSSTGVVSPGSLMPDELLSFCSWAFAELSTCSAPSMCLFVPDEETANVVALDDTAEATPDVPSKVYELRRLTGLSWEQLSSLLGVSRRTLHNWATGGEIAAKNEEKLARVHSTINRIDRGSASKNRSLLFSPTSDGNTLYDQLRQELYEEVKSIAGPSAGRLERRLKPLDENASRQLAPERFGEALERAVAGPQAEAAGGDVIVRKLQESKMIRPVKRTRAE